MTPEIGFDDVTNCVLINIPMNLRKGYRFVQQEI